jgi:hypothetical protein
VGLIFIDLDLQAGQRRLRPRRERRAAARRRGSSAGACAKGTPSPRLGGGGFACCRVHRRDSRHLASGRGLRALPGGGREARLPRRDPAPGRRGRARCGAPTPRVPRQGRGATTSSVLALDGGGALGGFAREELRAALAGKEMTLDYPAVPRARDRPRGGVGRPAGSGEPRRDAAAGLRGARQPPGVCSRSGPGCWRPRAGRRARWQRRGSRACGSWSISPRTTAAGWLRGARREALAAGGLPPTRAPPDPEGTSGTSPRVRCCAAALRGPHSRSAASGPASSLAHLRQLPVDALKIDLSFVRGATTDADDASVVTAVIAVAHSLGLRVIAQGVESEAQVVLLRSLGCDEVQGFLWSPPVPPAQCERLLVEGVLPAGTVAPRRAGAPRPWGEEPRQALIGPLRAARAPPRRARPSRRRRAPSSRSAPGP